MFTFISTGAFHLRIYPNLTILMYLFCAYYNNFYPDGMVAIHNQSLTYRRACYAIHTVSEQSYHLSFYRNIFIFYFHNNSGSLFK